MTLIIASLKNDEKEVLGNLKCKQKKGKPEYNQGDRVRTEKRSIFSEIILKIWFVIFYPFTESSRDTIRRLQSKEEKREQYIEIFFLKQT